MFNQLTPQLTFVVISMVNSLMYLNYLEREVIFLKINTFSLVILLTEAIIQLKLLNISSAWRLNTLNASLFSEVITNLDKLLKLMAFTMKFWESTVTLTLGTISLKSSITSPWVLSLMDLSSVSMVVFLPILKLLIKSELFTESKKFPSKVPSQISYGQTLMMLVLGLWTVVVLVGYSVIKLQLISTT